MRYSKNGIEFYESSPEDAEQIVNWRNQEFIRDNSINQSKMTVAGHMQWYEANVLTGKTVQFLFAVGGAPVGSFYIKDISNAHRKGEYGVYIGNASMQGKGIGSAATRFAIEYAFSRLNLHRLYLHAFAENIRAIRSYEKAGFVREGCLAHDAFVNGVYRDIVVMGIVKA